MRYLERGNYTPPSDDEASLGNDKFGVPTDPVEQVRFRRRLMATTRSLQRKQQQLKLTKIYSWIGGPRYWPPKNTNSTAPAKGIQGTTGYPNLSGRTKGTQPNVRTPPRFLKPQRAVLNVKPRKMAPSPATPSLVNGQRIAQAYSARATYLINRVQIMVLLEGRQSIAIENAGSSKQSDWSCAGNNEGRRLVKRPPRAQQYGQSPPIIQTTTIQLSYPQT